MSKIVIVILSILCLILINSLILEDVHMKYDKSLNVADLNDVKFRTGDILFFRRENNANLWKDYPINLNLSFIANSPRNVIHFSQKYYVHSGIVIEYNGSPHIFELSSAERYDKVTKKYNVGLLSFNDIKIIDNYQGIIYKYDYLGPEIIFNINELKSLYNKNIKLSSRFNMLFKNYFKLNIGRNNEFACVDLILYMMNIMGIYDKNEILDLNDLRKIVESSKKYTDRPINIINKFYREKYH